jgi:hypothetical protein
MAPRQPAPKSSVAGAGPATGSPAASAPQHSTTSDIAHARFDRALAELQSFDARARVALDTDTGLAKGVDGTFQMPMPPAARDLPGSDRAAAAAVLFLDRFGGMFGIPGWHVLRPLHASPLGRSIWFAFEAAVARDETVTIHVCADEETVKYARVERPVPEPLG